MALRSSEPVNWLNMSAHCVVAHRELTSTGSVGPAYDADARAVLNQRGEPHWPLLVHAGDRNVKSNPVNRKHEEREQDFVPQFRNTEDVDQGFEHPLMRKR